MGDLHLIAPSRTNANESPTDNDNVDVGRGTTQSRAHRENGDGDEADNLELHEAHQFSEERDGCNVDEREGQGYQG